MMQELIFQRINISHTAMPNKVLLIISALFMSIGNLSAQNHDQVIMFRGNTQLTGVFNTKPIYNLKGIKFTFKTNGAIRGMPAVHNGSVYFGSGDGNFYSIDATTGKEQWRFTTGGPINASPAIYKDLVYFASRDQHVYAVNTKTGREVWRFKMNGDLGNLNYWDYYLSSPTIENGRLFIGSGDGHLYALNTKTGKQIWKYNAGSRIRTTAAINEQVLIFGTLDGYVYAIEKENGKLRWKFETEGASLTFESGNNDRTAMYCSPSIHNNTVVIGGRDAKLYAIDIQTGILKWKTPNDGGAWVLSTGIKDGKVYAGSGSSFMLQVVDEETGKELWRYKTRAAIFSSIVLIDDMIYFNDRNGNVYGLDNDGMLRWRFAMGGYCFSTPAVANGIVYAGADGGILYALENGGASEKTNTINPTKVVYWEPAKSDTSFNWFQSSLDVYYKNYFVAQRYQLMNAEKLKKFMTEVIQNGGPTVVVFANNKIPPSVVEEYSEKALIRKYLDAGGKVVLLSDNPLSYVINTVTAKLDTINYLLPEKVFGIKFPPHKEVIGFYNTALTESGKQMGLRDHWTNFGIAIPGSNTETLAIDEFGKAVTWLKNYGGKKGTGLLQFNMSRSMVTYDLTQLINVIEFGIDW
jgi:eukaryotic-like serine/threonine-protein kinase